MPARSKAQQRYFGMLVGSPARRKKAGVSLETAKDFARAPGKKLPARVGPPRRRPLMNLGQD